jgi:hypothetical protein
MGDLLLGIIIGLLGIGVTVIFMIGIIIVIPATISAITGKLFNKDDRSIYFECDFDD